MPYLDIRSSKPIDETTRNNLQLEICKIMPVLPGKNVSNTVICISDTCTMYNEMQPIQAVFIDVRLYKASPEDSKKEFAKQLTAIFESVLQIPPPKVQINFFEQPNWAVNGDYF